MSFVDVSEGTIENPEEALSSSTSGVDSVKCLAIYFAKRKVLDHDYQDGDCQGIDIGRGHLVSSSCFNLPGSIHCGASGVMDTRTYLLSVT